MGNININTKEIHEYGNEIISLSKELQTVINTMFDRIHNIPITTGEWIGEAAEQFVSKADKDRGQYLEFCREIYNYGRFLAEYSESTDESIRGVDVR